MRENILGKIDPAVLGVRLQEARKASGLTQQSVAEEMSLARTTLVAIEKGERRLTPHEIIKLAGLYNRSVSDFLSHTVVTGSFVPQFLRTWHEDMTVDKELENVTEELQLLAENYLQLEQIFGIARVSRVLTPYNVAGTAAEQTAEEIATAERNRLGLGDGPISHLRERLETDVGLHIFYFPMPAKVSGLFAYNDTLGGCIGININHPRDRRNWSLAHEYGHFLTNRYQTEITFLTAKRRQSFYERLADAFAENFLLPANGLNRRFTELHRSSPNGITLAQLCTLADLYQVSVQSLIIRLEKLRRFPTGMWEGLAAKGFKPRQAQELLGIAANPPVTDALPQHYVNLAVMGYDKGEISEGQLAKFLRVDRVTARLIAQETSSGYQEVEGGFARYEVDLAQALIGR